MMAPLARILVRYAVGALVVRAWLTPDDALLLTGDPELIRLAEMGLMALPGAATEVYYWLAKRYGWAT